MQLSKIFMLALLAASSVWAQAPAAPQSLEEAAAQRARAAAMRQEAERILAAEKLACRSRFLLNDCLENAHKAYTRAMIEARGVEKVARDFEREEKRHEVDAAEAARAADLAGRDAAQQADGERFRAEERDRAETRERKLADKEAKAAEGRRRLEAEQAARQSRLAARAKKDAERAAKRAEKEAAARRTD